MQSFPRPSDGTDYLAHLRRLVAARWIVLTTMALLVVAAPSLLDIPLPPLPLAAVLGVSALFNGLAANRLSDARSASATELFTQLSLDIATLCALNFFSGGATNPLISLLLPLVAVAALTLPARHVLATGILAIAAYTLLMVFYVPLPLADAVRATRLHLVGMWLTFVVSSVMIAWFVVRMTALVRQRDGQLAAAREQALRDERVVAIGTLAAGAAHELGTPLATMALLAGELVNEAQLSTAARDDIALLRQQIQVCKGIITGLSRRAGAERPESSPALPADQWLDALCQRWQAARPHVQSRLARRGPGPAPAITADPRLEQALLNLLNNAANASRQTIELTLDWSPPDLVIEVRDRGPGFPPSVLERGGESSFPAHEHGIGIGLMLTRSAIEQLGGRLILNNPDDGGALARVELPQETP